MKRLANMRSLAIAGLALSSTLTGAAAQTGPAAVGVKASTLYYAVVDFDGKKVRSTRGVKSRKLSTGQYQVIFKRNVSKCAYSATVGAPSTTPTKGGYVRVASLGGNARGVHLATISQAKPADRPFHLIVVCP